MKPEYQKYELIDRYLKNELSEEELQAFTTKRMLEEEFNQQVEEQKIFNESFVEYQLNDLYTKLEAMNPYKQKSNFTNWKGYLGAFILATVLGGTTYYFIFKHSLQNSNTYKAVDQPAVSSKPNTFNPDGKNSLETYSEKEKNSGKKSTLTSSSDSSGLYSEKRNSDRQSVLTKETSMDPLPDVSLNNSLLPDPKEPIITTKTSECSIKIKTVNTEPSCNDQSNGILKIDFTSIEGGLKPYSFSIDEGKNFHKGGVFYNLPSGNYLLQIKDAANCISTKKELIPIGVKECSKAKEYSFNPDHGETWVFPVQEEATIEIFNAAGIRVYSKKIITTNSEEWNGRSSNGSELPSDVYLYSITYTDGRHEQGYVTILR